MIGLFCAVLFQSTPSLEAVHLKIRGLAGIEISGEMVRPTTIPMRFRIAPGGLFWAKYPTSEDFISVNEKVSWFPDRREFARSKPEDVNPLPAGFESLWPKANLPKQIGESKQSTFAGKPAVEIRYDAGGHPVSLFVDPKTLLPSGSIATAGGVDYEMRYISVKVRPLKKAELTFVAPSDAKPFSGAPPDSKLIRPGARLPSLSGKDAFGSKISAQTLLRGKRGLVVNFWFSSCTGCMAEMPYLNKLQPALAKRGIEFIGVNPIDPSSVVQRTSKTNSIRYRTFVGKEARAFGDAVGVIAYPVTLVIDADLKVVDAILGFDETRLSKALQRIGYVRA